MRMICLVILAGVASLLVLPPLWYQVFAETPPDMPPPGRRVEVSPGLSVNVIEKGSGRPVLLVHGHPGCAYDWRLLMDELAERGFHAIAYDRVGYGYSDGREPGHVTVETNAAELVGLLAALDLADAILVGTSYGGGASIVAMKRNPSRVERLVLLASVGPGIADRERVPSAPDWIAEFIAGPVFDWVFSVPPLSRRLGAAYQRVAFEPSPVPAWYAEQTTANFGMPYTRESFRSEGRDLGGEADLDARQIELPILIIHGTADRLAPPFVADANHERARDSRLDLVPAGGHMLQITHASYVADAIRDFAGSAGG